MKRTMLAVCTMLIVHAVQAGPILDLRDCPLDRLTFVDPVAGGTFVVTRAGADYRFLCGQDMVARMLPGADCRGPFGALVLAGTVREPDDTGPRSVFAVWTVEPAAPCCGWSVLDEADGAAIVGRPEFGWFAPDAVPALGAMGFADISFDRLHREGMATFSPKIAMRCEFPG